MAEKDKRKYLSGAHKRKILLEKEEAKKKLTKIDTLFLKVAKTQTAQTDKTQTEIPLPCGCEIQITNKEPQPNILEVSQVTTGKNQDITQHDEGEIQITDELGPGPSTTNGNIGIENCIPISESLDTNVDLKQDIDESDDEEKLELLPNAEFSTDRGLFPDLITVETKKAILVSGPCKPTGPFPKNPTTKRSFSPDYYWCKTKTGQKIERLWLCYSRKLDGVYCEPCWLFSESSESRTWCDGSIRDWKGLSKKIKVHETSRSHLQACLTYSGWKKNKTIENQISDERRKWKDILIRIIDVVRTLALCSLPYRGHREDLSAIGPQSGNFLNIIDLLSRYDSLLRVHISNEKNRTKYLHHDIQDQMVHLLSRSVLNTITSEINEAPFYSLILDTTQDISKKDQLSVVIRYVKVLNTSESKTKNEVHLKVQESFLGFVEVKSQTSESFEKLVIQNLEEKGIDLKRCRGQAYDGAANMSGKYTGLQARIKQRVPNADFVHCAAHNLNLVLNDSATRVVEVDQFYSIAEKVYVFFSESLPRLQKLNHTLAENQCVTISLKRLCVTRWSSRYDSVLALRHNFPCVMKCLSSIILFSSKSNERDEASSLMKKLETFEFILQLTLQGKVLQNVNVISKMLQSESADLETARNLLNQACVNLTQLRDNFDIFLEEARDLARSWNISCEMKQKRLRCVKKLFDEIASDSRIVDPLKAFQVSVFNNSLDIMINQMKRRFSSMNDVIENFSFLTPQSLIQFTQEEKLQEKTNALVKKYSTDLSGNLFQQTLSFRALLLPEIKKRKTIRDVATLLIEENNCLISSLPDLTTAFQLYLTLPVTSASAERSFSKLKFIKNYLRSTMAQERLSSLAVLSIEHEIARKVDLEKIVDEFVLLKKRRLGQLSELRK